MSKLVLILVPVVLLGAGAGLVLTGIIKVPGISPKAAKNAATMYAKDKEAPAPKLPAVAAQPPPAKPAVAHKEVPEGPTTKIMPEQGAKRVAGVWNDIDVAKLKDIVADWKDEELVKVLAKMDSDKVAELVSTLEPKRASKLSRALQKDASVVVVPPGEKAG